MNKKMVNVELRKEVFDDIKSSVTFKNVIIENETVNADVDEINLNIALHQAGWSQSDDFDKIHKVFAQTIEQLDKFRTILDDDYATAMLSDLDIEMFMRDTESLRMDIKDSLYLFEF